jgi:serine/threonine protein kinase
MPKRTSRPIVYAGASFFASSTYHLVLEALQPGQICLPECPHRPSCSAPSTCPIRNDALRKVASQLLLGISILHDQMEYIHADLKPENILRCRDGSTLFYVGNDSLGYFNEIEID